MNNGHTFRGKNFRQLPIHLTPQYVLTGWLFDTCIDSCWKYFID